MTCVRYNIMCAQVLLKLARDRQKLLEPIFSSYVVQIPNVTKTDAQLNVYKQMH